MLVGVSGFSGAAALADHQAALSATPGWPDLEAELARRTVGPGQLLRLSPTPRSRLR